MPIYRPKFALGVRKVAQDAFLERRFRGKLEWVKERITDFIKDNNRKNDVPDNFRDVKGDDEEGGGMFAKALAEQKAKVRAKMEAELAKQKAK